MTFTDIDALLAWLDTQSGAQPTQVRLSGPLMESYMEVHEVGSDLTASIALTDTADQLTGRMTFLKQAVSQGW